MVSYYVFHLLKENYIYDYHLHLHAFLSKNIYSAYNKIFQNHKNHHALYHNFRKYMFSYNLFTLAERFMHETLTFFLVRCPRLALGNPLIKPATLIAHCSLDYFLTMPFFFNSLGLWCIVSTHLSDFSELSSSLTYINRCSSN